MEPTSIPQRELRNDSARILREVQEGKEFVVTVRGVPVARLSPHVPVERPGPRTFVPVEEVADLIEQSRRAFGSLREIRDSYDPEMRY